MEYLQHIYYSVFGYSQDNSTARRIIIFGNVLLDQTLDLKHKEQLLEKYELPNIKKAEVDAEILSQLTADLCSQVNCTANPGGSALNTARFLKQLGTEAVFFGAVGEDDAARKLKDILKEQQIDARLQTVRDQPTGQCVCLLRSEGESWYANIGASQYFSINYLRKHEKNATFTFRQRQIIYMEAFFLTKREEVIDYIVQTYIRERRRLAINLSAPYIVQEYYKNLLKLAKHAYFIFGNEEEFSTLAKLARHSSIESLSNMLLSSSTIPKIIAITKGAQGVTIISNYVGDEAFAGEACYQSFKAPRAFQVVDTTGAGDAFVAGFLQAWLEKRQLSECVRVATNVAAKVVTQIGAQFPEN